MSIATPLFPLLKSNHASPNQLSSSSAPGTAFSKLANVCAHCPSVISWTVLDIYFLTFPPNHADITSLYTLAATNQQSEKPLHMDDRRKIRELHLCLYSLEDDLAPTILQNLPEEATDEDGRRMWDKTFIITGVKFAK